MKNIFKSFIDYLAPNNIKCIVCDDELPIDNNYCICKKCHNKLPFINKSCQKCGREIYDEATICIDCKEGGLEYDKVYSIFNYQDEISSLIYRLKYGGELYLVPYLAQFIADKIILENISFDYIVPVPLNENRQKKRGFNQAEVLAEQVCKILSTKYKQVLTRQKDTPFQARLTREERLVNLKDAFVVNDKTEVKGKTILLLDDIFTTGSTISECCKVLNKAKTKSVIAICLSHAKKNLSKNNLI